VRSTPQCTGLEALHQRCRVRGLQALGFPRNDFVAQEPGTEEAEIQSLCEFNCSMSFPLFATPRNDSAPRSPLYAALLAAAVSVNGPAMARAPTPPVAPCDAASMQLVVGSEAIVVAAVVNATSTVAPSYCRVDGYATASGPGPKNNQVRVTLSMPQAFANRYNSQGEGGSAGFIPEPPEELLTLGFASAGANADAGSPTLGVAWTFALEATKAYDYAQRGAHSRRAAAQLPDLRVSEEASLSGRPGQPQRTRRERRRQLALRAAGRSTRPPAKRGA
jgi:hypothetical protein